MNVLGKIVLLLPCCSLAATLVSGSNETMNMEPGARSAALGSATMAVDGDYLGLVSNPYQLANVRYMWASFSHTAYYEDTQYDFASVTIPLGLDQGLGISFARFGADDIPYIREGDALPEGSDYETLSIADWMLSATWGKKIFDRFELGVGFHLLYRDMDQSGFGFRGDAGLRYRIMDDFYVAGLLKGWTSSATVWGSGEFEYAAPDLYLAASYGLDVRYLYGKFGFYWQSAGVFRHEPRDLGYETDESRGKPLWKSPLDWLSGGHAGIEFNFDFGLSLRAGLSSFTTFESFTAGAGLVIAKFLRVDYAFESHPVLSPVHRVSVSISPYLFGHAPKPEPARPAAAPTSLLGEENENLEESKPAGEAEQAPQESAPASPVVEESSSEVQESSDEVLEPRPSGGIQWEE